MWPSAVALFVIALSILSTQSRAQISFAPASSAFSSPSRITCTGKIPPGYPLSSILNPSTVASNQPVVELATYCYVYGGTRGGWKFKPNHLTFDFIQNDYWRGKHFPVTAELKSNWQKIAELCYIKCNCALKNDDQEIQDPKDIPRSELGIRPRYKWPDIDPVGFEDIVYEWNFDLSKGFERVWDGKEEIWAKRADISVMRMADGRGPTQSQYYVGSPRNKPLCLEDDEGGLPSLIELALRDIDGSPNYSSSTELCIHRYYGGNDIMNAGGVCLFDDANSRPRLQFPYALKGPIFTTDAGDANTLSRLSIPIAIEQYCRAVCWCSHRRNFRKQPGRGRKRKIGNGDSTSEGSDQSEQSKHPKPGQGGSGSGFIPFSGSSDSISTYQGTSKQATCQGECSGPQQCGDECNCRIVEQAVDPVNFSPAVFIARCAVSLVAVAITQGKNLPRTVEQTDMICPCNASYVSKSCCESSGIVWEAPELKLGHLMGCTECEEETDSTNRGGNALVEGLYNDSL